MIYLKNKRYKVLVVIFITSFMHTLTADIVGSNAAVSVESTYEFPSLVDNIIANFAWMKNGFTLADQVTTCSFESVFPVGGIVNLRGGSLYLNTDLCFNEKAIFKNSGTVSSAHAQTIDLAPTMTYFGNTTYETVLDNVSLNLHYDLVLEGTLSINRDVIINGNNHILDIGSGAIFVRDSSSITLNNLVLIGIDTSNIACESVRSTIYMKDVCWYQDANTFTFTQGSIEFKNNVSLIGSATFNYASAATSTVVKNSTLRIADGMYFNIGRASEAAVEPLYFEDPNSVLYFDNGNLSITEYGANLTRGSMLIGGKLHVDVAGTTSTTGLKMGNVTAEDDLRIELLPGSHVMFLNGHVALHFYDQTNFRAQAPTTQITRKAANTFSLLSNIQLSNVTVEAENGSILLLSDNTNLYYDNVTVLLGKTALDVTGYRYNAYTNILSGDDELFLSKGTLPAYTRVEGTGNYLRGLGSISGLVYLTGSADQLYIDFDGNVSKSIQLNGGTVDLLRNLQCSYDATIVGTGVINLHNNTWYLGGTESVWNRDVTVKGLGGRIHYAAPVRIDSVITCSGDVTFEGEYSHFIFGQNGQLIIQPYSAVTFKNINIEGLRGTNIVCIDDTGVVKFENVRCLFDDSFTYTMGAINIYEEVEFRGTGTFSYQSEQPLTIDSGGSLLVNQLGLSVSKTTSTSVSPLYFEDKTGILHLKNTVFTVGQYGISLLKGSLVCEDTVDFSLNSTGLSDGFIIGDTTAENDAKVLFLPGSTVTYRAGSYIMNFFDRNGFVSRSNTAYIIRKSQSYFYFNTDMDLPILTIDSEAGSTNFVASGKSLSFNNCSMIGDGYEINLRGHRYNQFTNTLNGNDEISLTKGILPANTRVESSGNIIRGTGDIGGKITLVDQNAILTIALSGSIYKDIALNNGTLVIARDLTMAYNSLFTGSGVLQLEKSTVTLGLQEGTLTSTILIKSIESSLGLRNRLLFSGRLTISGDITIEGRSNIFEFMPTASLIVAPHTTVRFKNIILKNIEGTNLYATDTSSRIVFENSACILSGDYSFTTGSLVIEDDVLLSGEYTCTFNAPSSLVIKPYSSLILQDNLVLATGRYGSLLGIEPITFESNTSQLMMKNATLRVLPSGMTLSRGQWTINENVTVDVRSTGTIDGLIMGDGIEANDLTITFLSGARVNFIQGHATYNMSNPYQIQSFSKNSNLRMEDNASFYIKKDCVLKTLYLESEPFAIVSTASDAYLKYENCLIEMQGEQFNITGKNNSQSQGILLDGGDSIILDRGTFYSPVTITGINNKILGSGTIAQGITLQDSMATVTLAVLGDLLSSLSLQGGRLYLGRDLTFSSNGMLTTEGIVELGNNTCFLSHYAQEFTHTITWIGESNSRIKLMGNYMLNGIWRLQGNIIIEGNANTRFAFENNGFFDIAPSSTIRFKGISFDNFCDRHIHCVDSSSIIIFEDCKILVDNDFTLTAHRIEIQGRTIFSGSYAMTFSTEVGLCIVAESSLELLQGAHCYFYVPSTYGDPLLFNAPSAQFVLYDSTLHLVDQSVCFCGGKFIVKGASAIVGTSGTECLYWGNGSVDADIQCFMKAGSKLMIDNCTIGYKNMSIASCIQDPNSTFIFGSTSILSLYQSLYAIGGLIFEEGATLNRVESALLSIPITMRGAINYGAL